MPRIGLPDMVRAILKNIGALLAIDGREKLSDAWRVGGTKPA